MSDDPHLEDCACTARLVRSFPDAGVSFIIPPWAVAKPDERPSSCRSCKAPILWVIASKSGKPAPIDPDGVSHFATCPQAARTDQP